MSVYELKLAKMATKKTEIRPSATERPYGLRPKKVSQNRQIFVCFTEKCDFKKISTKIDRFLL